MGLFTNTKGVKSFSVIECNYEPVFQYIPTDKECRNRLYKSFEEMSVKLPDYKQFEKKKFFNVRDLLVLRKDFEISFIYMNKQYKYIIKKGFFTDGASIPWFVQFFRISKISQYSLIAALVHDTSYGSKYFIKSISDDLFESLLRYRKTPKITVFLHMFFLRIFGGFVYNEPDEESEFQLGFVELYCEDKLILPYVQIYS